MVSHGGVRVKKKTSRPHKKSCFINMLIKVNQKLMGVYLREFGRPFEAHIARTSPMS